MKKLALIMAFAVAALAVTAYAKVETKTFVVGDPKFAYRNVAIVESESEFESFTGKTSQVSGAVVIDFAKKNGTGTLEVDVASIDTGIPLRNEHMKGSMWMDATKFPTIKFSTKEVRGVGNDFYNVPGTLTLHGISKAVTAKVRIRYRAASAATKAAGFGGDVLQISTKFAVRLSDYGISIPPIVKGKVAEVVTIGFSGYAISK